MWMMELKKIVGDDIVCVIVGNKQDLIKEQKVQYDPEPHETYAKSNGAIHFLTSAKLNENIDEVFLEISKKMIKAYDEKQSTNLNRSNSMRRQLRVEEDQGNPDESVSDASTSRCCGR
jgi:GTPase SAR1 family protein